MEKIKLIHNSYSINIYHRQGQTNEKLVFLHGGGLDNAMLSWKEVIEAMGNQYDIYAIDLLGYGESDKPDIVYSIPMNMALLYDVLRQLNIEKTHLVGLSMGGAISIGFSLKFPEKVNKLVLVDAMGFSDRVGFYAFSRWFVNSKFNAKSYGWMGKNKKRVKFMIAATLIGDKNKISDELVSTIYHLINEPNCNLAWASFQRYELGKKKLTTDLRTHLNELKMPVLIVNGEKDTSVPVESAITASKVIKNSQLYIMRGCKHWAQKERPNEFAQTLEAFLRNDNV